MRATPSGASAPRLALRRGLAVQALDLRTAPAGLEQGPALPADGVVRAATVREDLAAAFKGSEAGRSSGWILLFSSYTR